MHLLNECIQLYSCRSKLPSQSHLRIADVYAFGIIAQEVVLSGRPYCANFPLEPADALVELIKAAANYRPYLPTGG